VSIRQKSIALCGMNWPMFSLNFGPDGNGYSRMVRSGNRRVAILESKEKSAVIISRFRQDDTWRVSFIDVQIAGRNFRASAAYAVPSHASPAVARTTAANSMRVLDYGVCGRDAAPRRPYHILVMSSEVACQAVTLREG
jgi:hypothetical protein